MAGVIHDPIQFINLIADNLRDRYPSGFPILKELIQNTEDSKASDMAFGLSLGLPGADRHVLLQGPGLFLVNNGQFSASDARGIRSFGQNSKAADQASIGKFGLGMKSVFHFCEAFFFLAHDGERVYEEVFNPWSSNEPDLSLHAEWDNFTRTDTQVIRERLSAVTSSFGSEPDRLFLLWLPLRRKAHLQLADGSQAGAIVPEYPGDDESKLAFLDAEDLPIRIAALTPMLRHLKRISYWRLGSETASPVARFEISVGQKAQRVSLIDQPGDCFEEEETLRNVLKGKVTVMAGQSRKSLDFSGLEAYGWNPTLLAMHTHELWPSSYVRDRQGRSDEAKDKAQPHGTVFFSRTSGKGSLIANWSVFLPLDEEESAQEIACEGEHDFRLTLHGYFFIDAGRRAIHGIRECAARTKAQFDSEDSLRRSWNCVLLHSTVLPLLLPALDAFCTEHNLADKSCTVLTAALRQMSMVKNFLSTITSSGSWLREMTPSRVHWALRDTRRKILLLPVPPSEDPSRPWRLFPNLATVSAQCWIAVDGAPNIVNSASTAQWSEAQLVEMLVSVVPQNLFLDAKLLDYLINFLKTAGPFCTTLDVRKTLADLIRKGLAAHGEAGLSQNEKLIRELVSRLDPATCFKIGNDLPMGLLQGLLSADTQALPLPARFVPTEARSETVLLIIDAVRFLEKVEQTLTEHPDADPLLKEAALNLSEQIIKGVPSQQRGDLLKRCEELRVLGGFDCREDKRTLLSVKEIQEAGNAGTLFGSGEGIKERARLRLAVELQQVLPRDRVLVINRDTANLALNVNSALPQCDDHAVLRCLGLEPRTLGGIDHRVALTGKVGVPEDVQEIRGLRFLLHADQEHFEDDGTLWVLAEGQDPVWRKLWAQLVDNAAEPWNLLKGRIADKLSWEVKRKVGIREIRDQTVLEELANKGVSSLNPALFSREEGERILMAVRDDEQWRTLPFHWTTADVAIAGDLPNAYLDSGDISLGAELLQGIHLIVASDEPALRQRQQRLLTQFDENAVIRIALERIDVPEVWRVILEALSALAAKNKVLNLGLTESVKQSRWLPSTTGERYSPQDIIDLDAAAEEIDRILAQAPGVFITPANLTPPVQAHPFFPQLREEYCARDQRALEQLSLVLRDLPGYQIGVSFVDCETFAEAAGILETYSHPGWRLLSSLITKLGAADCYNALLKGMNGPMILARQVELLNWIADRGNANTVEVRGVFNRYLDVLAQTPNAQAILGKLKLLNQEHEWRPSETLVCSVTGVSPSQVLHDDHVKILAQLLVRDNVRTKLDGVVGSIQYATRTDSAASILRDYFDPWTGRVASPLLGMVVLLLGGDESVKQRCDDILRPHSRTWLVEQVPWVVPFTPPNKEEKEWLEGKTLEGAIDYFRMSVGVNDSDTIKIRSIIGKTISVRLDKRFHSLFVGCPEYYSFRDGYRVDLILRKIKTEEYTDSQLEDFLCHSVIYLLREIYNQQRADLSALWDELRQSDQIDIDLAKALMLDNIPFYLKQLGTHNHPTLSKALERFREYERREKEFAGKSRQQAKQEQFRKLKEAELAKLQRIIEQDESVQDVILEAVKRKIRDYQYQPESVPFELFQNADDSLRDLEFIDAYPAIPGGLEVEPLPAGVRRFVVETDAHQMTFMHWGRAINQFGSKGFPGRQRGFDRDLENMLIISASDKGKEATGKFGLGFKSVWLISDRPTIISGRLRANIVGGLLPVPRHDQLTQRLLARLAEIQSGRRWPGTAIHLPLNSEISEGGVLDHFCGVAGAMVAFSRTVKTIEVRRADGSQFSATWNSVDFPNCPNIQLGRIRQSKGDPLLVAKWILTDGALLLAIGPRGFTELPREIPHFWVTAPIREDERFGFAINAMFEVDAGRSRLSADLSANRNLAARLGEQLAGELERFQICITNRWVDVVEAMQLGQGVEPYHLWESLWRTFLEKLPPMQRESGSRVVATALLSKGLGQLMDKHSIVPNGLPEGLHRLIRWSEAKTVLKGALGDPEMLRAVMHALCFRSLLDLRYTVSSELATWLRVLFPEQMNRNDLLISVSLAQLMAQLDRSRAVQPQDAEVLGAVLNSEMLVAWEKRGEEVTLEMIKDFKAAVEKSSELMFLSATDQARRCKTLLTNQGGDEEQRRWSFAPEENRLAGAYGKQGTTFFLLCRSKLDAPKEKLREWVINAKEDEKRRAALRYLVDGELSRQVVSDLQEAGFSGTWLAEIGEDSKYLFDWDPSRRARLVYQILKTPTECRDAFQNWTVTPKPPPIDPRVALNQIYSWWEAARDSHLQEYNQTTYPENRLPVLQDNEDGDIDRSSWLTLLLLGGFHTMGRVRPEQHRTFIEDCQRRGWWNVFIGPYPTHHFEDWMKVLDHFIDRQVDQQDYEQWMMRFPIIYKLSRQLNDYAFLMLDLVKRKSPFSLQLALSPKADADQDINAAPLANTLGIGANFVIRELIRLGVVGDTPYLREHAFVPYRKVRKLITELGCLEIDETEPRLKLAPLVFRFISSHMEADKVTFCKDFDIPLRIVADDPTLQLEFLGRQLVFD